MSEVSRPDSPTRVLIVDDEVIARTVLRESLLRSGYDVTEAEDGQAAVEEFTANPFDLVVLDIEMPRMDGYQACKHIRGLLTGIHVPIIMLTGRDDPSSIQQAFDVGATDFATKPINYLVLQHRLQYVLRTKDTADALRRRERELVDAHRIARLCHWSLPADSDTLQFSDNAKLVLGVDPLPVTLRALLDLINDDDRTEVSRGFADARHNSDAKSLEYRIQSESGTRVVVQRIEPRDRGSLAGLAGTLQDVSETRAAEERVRYLAYFDEVTGLPNRAFVKELLNHALEHAAQNKSLIGLLFLDLDHFKRINDTLGHDAGDALLREVAKRLSLSVRNTDRVERGTRPQPQLLSSHSRAVSRLGGDEFVILLGDLKDPKDPETVIERILHELAQPFRVGGQNVYVSSSIGVSIYPHDGKNAETLLENADAAMYAAKESGRGRHEFYRKELHTKAARRFAIETALRSALARNELSLWLQPKISVATGEVVGAEALSRWRRPNGDSISPEEFIPVAEETGLVGQLGTWVIETACTYLTSLTAAGLPDLTLSINISAVQLRDDDFCGDLENTLADREIAPERLEIELTESMLMEDTDGNLETMRVLEQIGVSISIDDFGTGYSSLSYLNRFPLTALKIDKSFVRDIATSPGHASIVDATIALAHSLQLRVIAEGVENEDQLRLLRAQGCEEVQGFMFGVPMPLDDFIHWASTYEPQPVLTEDLDERTA